jgi:hypothetical protein
VDIHALYEYPRFFRWKNPMAQKVKRFGAKTQNKTKMHSIFVTAWMPRRKPS